MAYRHNDQLHKHKVRANRTKRTAIIVTTVVLLVVIFVAVDWLMNQLSSSNTVVSRENTTSVQSANVSAYRTEYFQFQAPDDWIAVAGESTDRKFVYVKNKDTLITQKLTVYVDREIQQREADFKATHVLSADTSPLGSFVNIGEVSDHCGKSWSNVNRDPARITHANVTFVCNPDSGQYNIIVGTNGGDEAITFDGFEQSANSYTIIFSDLTAYPSPGDLYNIISSFNAL